MACILITPLVVVGVLVGYKIGHKVNDRRRRRKEQKRQQQQSRSKDIDFPQNKEVHKDDESFGSWYDIGGREAKVKPL